MTRVKKCLGDVGYFTLKKLFELEYKLKELSNKPKPSANHGDKKTDGKRMSKIDEITNLLNKSQQENERKFAELDRKLTNYIPHNRYNSGKIVFSIYVRPNKKRKDQIR